MQTGYLTHRDCLKHEMGAEHPERPGRLGAIDDALIASGLLDLLRYYDAPKATLDQLKRVHTNEYVDATIAMSPRAGHVRVDPDTLMNPYTVDAALRAAGAVVLATDRVIQGAVQNAFCAIRPPGHHAQAGEAMGFCFFNNIAVGVAHALHDHGIERVAVLDFDAHHGNGTEAIFEDEPRVMICSAYQHPLYPYTGRESVDGHLINVPLAPGAGSAAFRVALEERWRPQLEVFEPGMLFVSAGFDGHREDEATQLNLSEADYAWVTGLAMAIADRYAQGRIVSALEGGYALHALGRSVAAHIKTLMRV